MIPLLWKTVLNCSSFSIKICKKLMHSLLASRPIYQNKVGPFHLHVVHVACFSLPSLPCVLLELGRTILHAGQGEDFVISLFPATIH